MRGTHRRAGHRPEARSSSNTRAEVTGGRFWRADSSARLGDAFWDMIEAMNTRYVLRYDPGPDAKPGHHRIEVRLKGVRGDVRARQGYWRAK